LAFAALPPLIFYSVYCLMLGRWGARRAGITIGVLFAADFLISAERALMTAIVLVVVALVSVVFAFRKITLDLIKRVAWASLWSVGVGLAILVIPLMEMTGHAHVAGASHPWIQSYETDLIAIFFPGPLTWFNPFHVVENHGLALQQFENGAYLGIPLIALFVWGVVRGWRSRLVRIGAVSTLIILGMSMGEVLKINATKTSFHSPYKILTTIKYVENILPVRFMYFVWLGVALIAAYGLDRIARPRRVGAHSHPRNATARVVAACGVFALIGLTLLPVRTYPMVDTGVPPWLNSAEAARVIAKDSVVLYYPYPQFESNHGMLNQVATGFPYKIIGGEAIVGDANGKPVGIVPLDPLELPSVFIRAYSCLGAPVALPQPCLKSGAVPPHAYYLPPFPPNNAATVTQFHRFVVRNHVSTILMEASYTPEGKLVMPYLTAAFGQPLVRDGGLILVWTKPMLNAAVARG
jgi:hypothetical protein